MSSASDNPEDQLSEELQRAVAGGDGERGGGDRQRTTLRRAAIEILQETESTSAFVDEVLSTSMDGFVSRDRHLLQEICFGTIRHQNTLDRLLKPYLKVGMHQQRPAIRHALRIGAYQLVYLARIPAHAAVDQTLEGLKALPRVKQRDVGFVNAVLHKLSGDIVRKQQEPPENRDDPNVLPIRRGYCHFARPVLALWNLDRIDHLSVKYSHPRWLVQRWLSRFGDEEARRLFEMNNRVPPLSARVTARAPSEAAVLESLANAGFEVSAGAVPGALVLAKGDLSRLVALDLGWLQIQDQTAQEIGALLAPPGAARVLDLCASPGGKAAQLIETIGENGSLLAMDRSEEKLAAVRENLQRTGRTCWEVAVAPVDSVQLDLGRRFTHVLIDAPCSNTGVLARRPDARWRISRGDIDALGEVQSGLLEAAWRHLEPGGRLLYSTCSIEPEENEERIARFLTQHPDLTELSAKAWLPHRAAGDGGYASLLRRDV